MCKMPRSTFTLILGALCRLLIPPMLPSQVPRKVGKACKGRHTINLKPYRLGNSWNLNPSIIEIFVSSYTWGFKLQFVFLRQSRIPGVIQPTLNQNVRIGQLALIL